MWVWTSMIGMDPSVPSRRVVGRILKDMASKPLAIGEEVVRRKAFAWAIDWPGWCRAGKDPALAREALLAYRPRYAVVAEAAGLALPDVGSTAPDVVESVEGGTGTEFGVPSVIADLDRRPVTAADATRIAGLVEAAWIVFDRVAAAAPAELRKGPRGGGRDRDKMIGHVIDADHAYAREIGVRLPVGSLTDRSSVEAERAAMLVVLGQASDGTPLADRKWTQRYAARRIAWHALDHAWEMEDRDEP
jgi:hypothetical protein